MKVSLRPDLGVTPPTLRSELRRGVNLYNLSVGLGAAIAIGAGAFFAARAGLIPIFVGGSSAAVAVGVSLAAFAAFTAFHTAMHGYFGWRFERGLRAQAAGDGARAMCLLTPVAWRGMDHYDPHGVARAALESMNQGLQTGTIR